MHTVKTYPLVNNILEAIGREIDEEFYKLERYKISSSLAILHTNKDILSDIELKLRKTDRVYVIEGVYILLFKYTEPENAFKALQNLFHFVCPNDFINMNAGLISFAQGKSSKEILSTAIKKLNEAILLEGNVIEVFDNHRDHVLTKRQF